MNGNLDIGSGSSSVAINKDISSNFALDVSGITQIRGNLAVSGDFSIQQSTYPPTNDTMLGYTNIASIISDPMTTALAEKNNFSLPSKGVWLIICGYEFSSNTTNTIETKQVVLSLTTASSVAAAPGLTYLEQIDETATTVQARQRGTIMGVVSVTVATTIYVNARSIVNSGTNTKLETIVSWTRIG